MARQKQKYDPRLLDLIHDKEFWYWSDDEFERECPVCRVSMTGRDPWEAHITGRKHCNKMAQYGIYIKPPKKKEIPTYEEDLNDLSDSEKPVAEKTSTGLQYRCQICNIQVNDLHGYKAHITGQKHMKRKKEVGSVAFGFSDDSCSMCRIPIINPCLACVSNKTECEVYVGKCGHKVHKCCRELFPLTSSKCLVCPSGFEVVEIQSCVN